MLNSNLQEYSEVHSAKVHFTELSPLLWSALLVQLDVTIAWLLKESIHSIAQNWLSVDCSAVESSLVEWRA